MNQVQVQASDVVRLILQFLKQNNFVQSFATLQKQSKISLNIVNSNHLTSCIMDSRWDEVLPLLNTLMPTQQHAFALFQLIADDLIQTDRFEAANFILNMIPKRVRQCLSFKQQLMRLQYLIENPQKKLLYKKAVTEQRRREVVRQILCDVHEEVQPQRLLKLLAQAVKYQCSLGSIRPNIRLSLLENRQREQTLEQETVIKTVQRVVKYSEEQRITTMCLSRSEEYLALGGNDGIIEIYSTLDYSLHNGLKFQAEGVVLYHQQPIEILEFNGQDEMLLSVDSGGLVKIWGVGNGRLLRKIQCKRGISAACWGMDPAHVLVAHTTIHMYGIKSCAVLKDYIPSESRGGGEHCWVRVVVSEPRVYAVSRGGQFKIFNYMTQEEISSVSLGGVVVNVCFIYAAKGGRMVDRIMIATMGKVYDFASRGDDQKVYMVEGELVQWVCVGEFMYEFIRGHDKKCRLNVKSKKSTKSVYFCPVQYPPTLICMQSMRNMMVTYDEKHVLSFWRQNV